MIWNVLNKIILGLLCSIEGFILAEILLKMHVSCSILRTWQILIKQSRDSFADKWAGVHNELMNKMSVLNASFWINTFLLIIFILFTF